MQEDPPSSLPSQAPPPFSLMHISLCFGGEGGANTGRNLPQWISQFTLASRSNPNGIHETPAGICSTVRPESPNQQRDKRKSRTTPTPTKSNICSFCSHSFAGCLNFSLWRCLLSEKDGVALFGSFQSLDNVPVERNWCGKSGG